MSTSSSVRNASVLLALLAVTPLASAQDRTWNINGDGAWNDSANWDPADVPDTAGENAIVTSPDGTTGVTATLASGVTRELGDLKILDNGANPAHTVAIPNNTFLDVHGDIANDGFIELNSTGAFTRLRLDGSDLSLTGSGAILMGATGFNAISNATGTNTLTNGANHTISGRGRLGDNTIGIHNEGTIDANLNGLVLSADPSSALGLTNTGTMSGTNGGILSLTGAGGGEFGNTGGLIEAVGAASEIQLTSGAAVTGGTIRGTGGGLVRAVTGQDTFFIDVTFEGDVLSENNTDFGLSGTITNNAAIVINSTGSATDIELQSDTTLQGGGTITLQGPNPRVVGVGGAVLINGASHAIQGRGSLGAGSAGLVNNGLVDANTSGETLTVDPDSASGLENNNTMRASDGGILALTGAGGGGFGNTGGLIEAVGAASEVQLTSGAAVTGGTVRGTGGGLVRANSSQDVFFTDVTFEGDVQSDNNTDFGLSGTITNNAAIVINSTGSATDIELQSDTMLEGGGTVTLRGPNARVVGVGAVVLTNGASHAIQGRGSLGVNSTGLVNNGLVDANTSGETLTVDPDSTSGLENNNTMRASGGGILSLTGAGGGGFGNTGGLIEAVGAASEIQLTSGAAVTGGTVRGIGGGLVRANSGQNVFFTDVTFEGDVQSDNNTDFGLAGTITNNAAIVINSTGNATDIELQSDTTLQGSGTIALQGPNPRINSVGGDKVLTNNGNTIEGDGSIDTPIVNNGAIVGTSDTEFIEINQRVSGSGTLENVRIDNVHAPGDDVATVTVSGDYTIASTGELHIDIGGTADGNEYDQISATGNATLGGDLVINPIDLSNGYEPMAGDVFTVITSSSPLNGGFSTISLPGIFGTRVLTWEPVDFSDPTQVVLEIASSALLGDADGDGDVDGDDLIAVQTNFGSTTPPPGDADGDGDVDGDDLIAVQTNFGNTLATPVFVPEPASFVGLSLLAASVLLRRSRR